MLSVSCRDVGVDCDFKGTGETEEELMNSLVDHAIKDHGYTREYVMKPEMQEKIKAKIKQSWKFGCLKSVVNAKTLTFFLYVFNAIQSIWNFSLDFQVSIWIYISVRTKYWKFPNLISLSLEKIDSVILII